MDDSKNVLVVEVEQTLYDRIAPVLQRKDFEVDRFPDAGRALELVSVVPFNAIVVGYPMSELDLNTFLDAVQQGESAVASIAVLTSAEYRAEAEGFTMSGVDLVLLRENATREMQRLLCALLGVAPRASLRALVKLDLDLLGPANERFVAQTEDISATGMLIVTPKQLEIGTPATFTLTLPGDAKPIVGVAQVTRHTEAGVDREQGMGFRFVSFDNDGQARLEHHLERTLGPQTDRG
jgi:DNA-binding response OmpR family regulator